MPELEPNQGVPATVAMGPPTPNEGNDFDAAMAMGVFARDVAITAALSPTGDEDVFAVRNPGMTSVEVRFETFLGDGSPCGTAINTSVFVRDAADTILAGSPFEPTGDKSPTDRCSRVLHEIPAGTTVFAHVTHLTDKSQIGAYRLVIDFP